MLPEESIKHFIEAVQNMRTAQQRFFMIRTSGNLNTTKKWELLVDKELIQLKNDLNLVMKVDSTQGKIF